MTVVRKEPPARDRVGNFGYRIGASGVVLRITDAGVPVVRFGMRHVTLVNPTELDLQTDQ